MKLSRKILKFTKPLTYRRGLRRAQRSIFRVPLQPMLAKIDEARAREIQQRYANSTAGYAKYANIEPWLRLNRERAQDLKLHRSEPKRVLDLGCGGGFFLFIAKNLGHSVLGLDIEHVTLFTELLELFEVPRVVWRISAFEPLPDLGQKPLNRCLTLVKSSIGSPRSRLTSTFITRRRSDGGRRNGIFSWAICGNTSPRAARFSLD